MAEHQEFQLATDKDFDDFVNNYCDSTTDWREQLNQENLKVWDKKSDTSLNMVKVWASYADIEPLVLYDVLHDPDYRKVWDDNMVEGYLIQQLDKNNDVGYYSAKAPFGISSRDFVNQRSWRVKESKEHIIMNHSVKHKDQPEKKGFVRAWSYRTGYLVRSRPEGGCTLTYVTHSDPKGWIPHYLVNKVTTTFAPNIIDRLAKVSRAYEAWKKEHNPEHRPWRL